MSLNSCAPQNLDKIAAMQQLSSWDLQLVLQKCEWSVDDLLAPGKDYTVGLIGYRTIYIMMIVPLHVRAWFHARSNSTCLHSHNFSLLNILHKTKQVLLRCSPHKV